jgi:hypothetical protein
VNALNAGLATVNLGGREYALTGSVACRVCGSKHRRAIEEGLVCGEPYRTILDRLDATEGLTPRHLADHFRRHLKPVIETEAIERVRERAARAVEDRLEPVIGVTADILDDRLRLARRIVKRVDQRLTNGDVEPGIRDGLDALSLIAKYEPTGDDVFDTETAMQGFLAYMRATEAVLQEYAPHAGREALVDLSRRLGADPVMRRLLALSAADDV